MSAWGQEWDTGTVAEGGDAGSIPTFARWLKPKKTIELSTRYKAIEPEEEDEEEADRKSDDYGDDDDDDEPGTITRETDQTKWENMY